MIHAHGAGWDDPVEIYDFADSVVKKGEPWHRIERPEMDAEKRTVRAKYKADISEAWVYFTTGRGPMKDRKWNFIQCNMEKDQLVSRQPLPKGTTAFLVYGFKQEGPGRRNHVSSEVVVPKP